MGRAVKDAKLDKRDARAKLAARKEPYWRLVSEGAHLGYYRGERVGKWVARHRAPGSGGGYSKRTLGEADDVRDADGEGILTFAQADAAARRWFEELARGGRNAGPFTVGDALNEYLAGFTGKDIQSAKYRIEALIRPALGHIEVAQLTKKQVRDWLNARAAAPVRLRTRRNAEAQNERVVDVDDPDAVRKRRATANRDLTVLKAALNRAADDRERLPVDAWRTVKPFPDVDVARRRYLDDDEARRIVHAVTPEFRPMTQAALLTGGRYSELRRARVRDYDPQSRTLWLAETKSTTPRAVYLEDEGVALLEQASAGKLANALLFPRPDGKLWSASQQARPMDDACLHGKVERATFHDLRRTFGARLARKGVPMAVIAEAMGHADERITRKHYAHLAPSYVSETVRAAMSGMGVVANDGTVQRIAGIR
jgi:integrase